MNFVLFLTFYFMCLNVLPHVCLGEGVRSPALEVETAVSCHVGAET